MKEYSIAPIYDALLFPFVRSIRKKILHLCIENDYQSILDVCCGTGDQMKILQKNGFRVSGVDLSEKMIKVSQRGTSAAICRLEDASKMTFEDNSFDVAMTTFALHEKSGEVARAIVEEMVRVVKPGGDILLADYRFNERSSRVSKMVITTIEWIAGGEHYRNFREYIDRGGIESLLGNLPLSHVKDVEAGMRSVVIGLYRLNT